MNKYRVCKLVVSYRCWCHCLKHDWMYSYNTFDWLRNIVLWKPSDERSTWPVEVLHGAFGGRADFAEVHRGAHVGPSWRPLLWPLLWLFWGKYLKKQGNCIYHLLFWNANNEALAYGNITSCFNPDVKSGHNLSTQHVNRSQTIIFHCLHQ